MSEFQTIPLTPTSDVDNWRSDATPLTPTSDFDDWEFDATPEEAWSETGSDWDDLETEAQDDVNNHAEYDVNTDTEDNLNTDTEDNLNTDAEDNINTDSEDNANTDAKDSTNTEATPIDSLTIELDDIRFESANLHRFVVQMSHKLTELQSTVKSQAGRIAELEDSLEGQEDRSKATQKEVLELRSTVKVQAVRIEKLEDLLDEHDRSKATRNEVLELHRLVGRRFNKTEDRLERGEIGITNLEWKSNSQAAEIEKLQDSAANRDSLQATQKEVLKLHRRVCGRLHKIEGRLEQTESRLEQTEVRLEQNESWLEQTDGWLAVVECNTNSQAKELEVLRGLNSQIHDKATKDEVTELHRYFEERFDHAEGRIDWADSSITHLEGVAEREVARVSDFESKLQAQPETFEKRLQSLAEEFDKRLQGHAEGVERRRDMSIMDRFADFAVKLREESLF
jgi:chromosome segregation ATPase